MHNIYRRLITNNRLGYFKNYCEGRELIKHFKDVNVVKANRTFGQPTFETHPYLMKKGEVTPLITKLEYQSRRQQFVDKLLRHVKKEAKGTKRHIVIIPSATKKYMSDKIPYVFRQNSEFLYLTGCQEPDCCLVLTVGENSDTAAFTLFTREKDLHAELWDGPRTYPEDAPDFFGVDDGFPITDLDKFIHAYRKTHNSVSVWYDFLNPVQDSTHKIVTDFLLNTGSRTCESPITFIHELRLIKSPAEIELMQKSCDIASEAIADSIAFSTPGCGENQIFAKVDYECRVRGAEFLAYPPVVAGGERATVIHYINNNRSVNPNELVLMDAGCEYHGYSSDITRTWPISGTFSEQQKLVYEVVYDAQKDLIQFCKELPTLTGLFDEMCVLLGKNLQRAKLISPQPSVQYLMKSAYQLCPHHVSHYLGMDVHDTPLINRNIPIKPGMIITVEPGIYITGKEKHIPKEFHGIGIRIEDDILITEDGPVVLTRNCPKTIEDVEKLASQNN